MENNILPDELLDLVSGGRTLPDNWEQIADQLAPSYKKQYPNVTYEEACRMIKVYFPDKDDQKLIFEYIKKYF